MKKRFFGVLLCLCLLVGMIPPTAVSAWYPPDDITIKDATYYDSGALKEITAGFFWYTADADSRLVLMSQPLRSEGDEGTDKTYGDFTDLGYYGTEFASFDAAMAYDKTEGAFGIMSYSESSRIYYYDTNTVSMSFEESVLPLNENKIYYIYLWTQYGNYCYPDTLICAIQVQDGAVKYAAATGRNTYDDSVFKVVTSQATYDVTVVAGENMSLKSDSGKAFQTDLTAAMTPVVYTADTGYYFPEDYSVDTVNGIMVRRDNQSQITVYGTPSANAEITLTASTEEPPAVASVTFDGSTTNYATIDAAWNAAIALNTTEDNKATVTLLADCTAANTLTNTADYLVLDTNNKTLTTPNNKNGINADGGQLELIGEGTITGAPTFLVVLAILSVGGGNTYVDGVTIHHTGTAVSYNTVAVHGGAFHLLDGHLIADKGIAALYADTGTVYLYSGKIEGGSTYTMNVWDPIYVRYSDNPLYIVGNADTEKTIYRASELHVANNVGMNVEYSANVDGTNSTVLNNATEISEEIGNGNKYFKIQAFKKYTVTPAAETGGTVSGGGSVKEGESITLTATADDGYTFGGWYEGETKVSDEAVFTVTNVTANKTYTAKFTVDQATEPEPSPSAFDFTAIRALRASSTAVDHSRKTITLNADAKANNVAIYQNQLNVIPGGSITLADSQNATVKQNTGSFYVINNAGTASVLVDVTIDGVTEQYTLAINFSALVAENLRMYQRKAGTSEKDIVYGTDVGYVVGNEIHITPNAGIEYIGITKYQGTPGHYNGIITPVQTYPTYSTFEESTSSTDAIFVDWQGCIFVKRPTDGSCVEFDANYTLGTETSVYTVIVDFSSEPEFNFSSIRSTRTKNIVVDHAAKTITMDSDGRVSNVAIYKYQLDAQSDLQITLADKLDADITQNNGSFYIKDNGNGAVSVLVDAIIGSTTKQYTLTVNFDDGFDFTSIRTLRTKNVAVDHKNKVITVDSDGIVSNIAVYKAQNDIIKDGSIVLSDAQSASVVQNAGSFYIQSDGSGAATVLVDVTIGKITKQYTLKVNFSDGFDFENIRTLRASDIAIDHDTKKIAISASKSAENVALYISQKNVISGGSLTITDEKDSIVQKNSGSYYIIKQDDISESTVLAEITIAEKVKTYEITVSFSD